MRLDAYLADNRIGYAEFARRVQAANAGVVRKWALGLTVPRTKSMKAILRETEGAVQPNDFLEVAE